MSEEQPQLREQIAKEQEFVDRAYSILDGYRQKYRQEQRKIEANHGTGTPQARTERDAMAAHYGDQAARLEDIEDRLVFGRLDNKDQETVYVGRAGLRAEDGSRLLVDWRAPAAQPFYQATAVQPCGVVRRRHIGTHLRKVQSIEDEVLDSEGAQDLGLAFQGEGALMSALSSAREGHMSDIVSTIQREQDTVIRSDSKGLVVVQGGPGTGKTAVALHRAAYLLYTHRERLENSGVLILGPSRVFLRYIEQVLPSLGESGVVSLTMGTLLPGLQASYNDSPEVTAAKGSLAWIPTLRNAVASLRRLPKDDVTITIDGRRLTLTVGDVLAAQKLARRGGKAHNQARDVFALELIDVLVRQLADDPDPDTIDWWRAQIRDSKEARRAINLCWMPTKPTALLAKLYRDRHFLAQNAQGLSKDEIELVYRPTSEEWSTADIPLLDELEELLGYSAAVSQRTEDARRQQEAAELQRAQESLDSQHLGGGIVTAEQLAHGVSEDRQWTPLSQRARMDRTWAYGHIVVDEAQDLTPMSWHCLLRRCPSRSFTVVGDLDQARGHDRPRNWAQALGPAARGLSAEYALTVSYRTPRAVTDLAYNVLLAAGEEPKFPLESARDLPDAVVTLQAPSFDPEKLKAYVDKSVENQLQEMDEAMGEGTGRLAVIAPTRLSQMWGYDLEGDSGIDNRVSFLSAVSAKGLEFDRTIVVDPSGILADGPGDFFVAMTRCTWRLLAIHDGDLPKGWHTQAH